MKNSEWQPCAARCRRCSWRYSAAPCHNSSASSALLRRICSAAHRASPSWLALTHIRRAMSPPPCSQAAAWGMCGGRTSATGRSPGSKAGCSNCHSPLPVRGNRISTRAPRGQPPPGNCADSAGHPVATQAGSRASPWPPRQTSGCGSAAGGRRSCPAPETRGRTEAESGHGDSMMDGRNVRMADAPFYCINKQHFIQRQSDLPGQHDRTAVHARD